MSNIRWFITIQFPEDLVMTHTYDSSIQGGMRPMDHKFEGSLSYTKFQDSLYYMVTPYPKINEYK